jgi:hypothetical protein
MGRNILAGLILQDLPDGPDALSGALYSAAACTEAAQLQRRRMSRQSAAEKCSRCRAMLSPPTPDSAQARASPCFQYDDGMGRNILTGLILQDLPDCPAALSGAPYGAAACAEATQLQRQG